MNPMPLEYRILTALLLGCATVTELALRLSEARSAVMHRLQWLRNHKFIKFAGEAVRSRFGGPHAWRYELTPSGKEWALEMIGGVE